MHDFSAALQTAHVQLLGHGMVVQLFRSMGLEGEIGLTLNLCPKEPLTDKAEDLAAAVRHDGYANRWFLDPVYFGTYPEDMWKWYEKRGVTMPEILDKDMELISVPVDFLGLIITILTTQWMTKMYGQLSLQRAFPVGIP